MQITTGIRKILSNSFVYSAFQRVMGAKRNWSELAYSMNVNQSDSVLDIGCGPADILDYLPDVKYWGYDISESYIKKARKRFNGRGFFIAKNLTTDDLNNMPKFDFVIACGLLHHLDDASAIDVLKLAKSALKSGGKLITMDPCFVINQNKIAHFIISKDRGQNVRNEAGYMCLASSVFNQIVVNVKHRHWIPYTHCIMSCTK